MANIETRIEAAIEELEAAIDIDEGFMRTIDNIPDKPGRTALGEIARCTRDAKRVLLLVRDRLHMLEAAQEGPIR